MKTTMRPSFASLWTGETLSPYERACLHSFVSSGYNVTLFNYSRDIKNVPEGVRVEDAQAIVDENYTSKFFINQKPSLSHFSDLFRYKLFEKTDLIWIDCDMFLLRNLETLDLPRTILAKEHAKSICGAIMRLDNQNEALSRLVERTTALADKELVWGETGPRLLTKVFGTASLANAYHPKVFFPIHFNEFWKIFLPEHADECAVLCRSSYSVHLWNNIVVTLGIWKDFMPPEGSFLHKCFSDNRSNVFFKGTYPTDVMRNMIGNWCGRYSGADLPLGPLLRQFVPSLTKFSRKILEDVQHKLN